MKVVVFGASGGTGLEVLKQALAAGHEVLAFVRPAAPLPLAHPRLRRCEGSVFDPQAVSRAVGGQDAVVCALGAKGVARTTVRAEGTKTIVAAMQQRAVRRLVVVSTLGAGESWRQLSSLQRALFALLLRHAKADHDEQEAAVRASNLEWTLVRPGELTNKLSTGRYALSTDGRGGARRISRADVADVIVRALAEHSFVHQAVAVTGLR